MTNVHAQVAWDDEGCAWRSWKRSQIDCCYPVDFNFEEQMETFKIFKPAFKNRLSLCQENCWSRFGWCGFRLREVKLIKEATNQDFICLTPGIRPSGAAVGDQNELWHLQMLIRLVDYIVVGRPITQATDPVAAYHAIRGWVDTTGNKNLSIKYKGESHDTSKDIASHLLKIQAALPQARRTFTWASGIKSPIYTDNRGRLPYPETRSFDSKMVLLWKPSRQNSQK